MPDPLNAPEDGRDGEQKEGPFPWDEPPPDDPDAPRQRHDAFTEARKNQFLKALVKTGCILDACRKTQVAPRTVYRHQESDPRFREHCELALRMASTPLELTAWQRAVEGVDEEVVVGGGRVLTRTRYSESLLRLLLQGSNPKKYGPRPGFKRKRLLRHERKQMEREVRAEIAASEKRWTFEESIEALERKLEHFGVRTERQRLAAGWTKTPEGEWVPPGYAPIPGWQPPAAHPEGLAGEPGPLCAPPDPYDSM